MKRVLLTTLLFWSMSCGAAMAQQLLSGMVTDADSGEPLPGASLRLKYAGSSTQAGADGGFSLPVPAAADTLIISMIGYRKKQLPVALQQAGAIQIKLQPDVATLNKVVVNTGFYQIPQERATGSFTHIDSKLLNRSVSTNVLDRLEGVASGLQFDRRNISGENTFGNRPEIRVRGLTTIESDESPLIIVDNFPYESDISTINPNDVESITVLKDAAAASIWGARAGNGVIVITTKKGRYNEKAEISLTVNTNIGERPDLYYNPHYLPSETVMEIEKELFDRGFYAEEPQTAIPAYVELMIRKRDELISEGEFTRREALMKQTDVRSEVLKYLYQPSIDQQYALNISGGGEAYRYYLSAGYDRNRSSVIGNTYNRLNLGLQNSFRPTRNLELTAAIWYTQQRNAGNGLTLSGLSISGLGNASPYTQLADGSGEAIPVAKEWRLAYTEQAEESGLLDWQFRPLEEIQLADNTSKNAEIRLNGGIKYNFLNDFNLQATYQYVTNNRSSQTYYAPESYYARNMVNRFTQLDGTQIIPEGGILRGGQPEETLSHSGRLQLNYNKTFGVHEVAALAGGEIRQQISAINPGYWIFDYEDEVLTGTAYFDYTEIYPARPSGYAFISQPDTHLSQFTDRFLSYFGNASYTYKRRYTLSGSLRWDGSNLFGVRANQRGVPLWSLGASWNLSKEPFYEFSAIPSVRLRMTYGRSGNVNKLVSAFPTVRYSTDSRTGLSRASLSSAGNPDLRWEQVKTFNVGLNFATQKRRILGSIEYYIKNASDLIGIDYMDPTSGIIEGSSLENRINYADMQTRGLDIELTTQNIQGTFSWKTVGLFSYVSNKITNYNRSEVSSVSRHLSDNDVPLIVGESRDIMYALPWHGLDHDTGMPIIYIDGEKITDYKSHWRNYNPDDLLFAGITVPPYFGSLRNSFSFKNIILSAMLTWKGGYVFRRTSMAPGSEYADSYNHHRDYFNRWQQPGDEAHTDVPARTENYERYQGLIYEKSAALITSGNHIRLQDVSLSYTISNDQVNIPVQNIKIQAYARNLGILWRANENDLDPGYPNASYPGPMTIALGVQVQF